MHQQINLFQPVFRKQQKVFSAVTLVQISAAVLLLLILIAGHARWTLGGMRETSAMLDAQVNSITQQMGVLESAYQTPDTRALDDEIEQLRGDIEQRNFLLQQFDQLAVTHRSGFAAQFRTLAEIRLPGLWIEGVTVSDDERVEIRGVTLDAKLVPRFLQLLEKQDDLSATSFETVSMTRIDADKPHIRFVLQNAEGEGA